MPENNERILAAIAGMNAPPADEPIRTERMPAVEARMLSRLAELEETAKAMEKRLFRAEWDIHRLKGGK